MPRFEIDARFPDHRKVRRLPTRDRVAAVGVWTLAGAWVSGHNDVGFAPVDIVQRWDPRGRLAALLVKVDLWIEDEERGEQGYRFHDWPDWRPGTGLDEDDLDADLLTPEERKRAKARERKRRERERSEVASSTDVTPDSVTRERDAGVTVTRDVTRDNPPFSPPHPPSSHPAVPFGDSAYAATRGPARDARLRDAPPSDLAQRCVREFTPAGIARRDLRKLATAADEAHGDGASWTAIQHALVAWSRRSDCTPGLLPSLITEAVKAENGASAGRPEGPAAPRETRADATIRRLRGMKSSSDELRALPGGSA